MDNAPVTVVIPAFNAANFIAEAINSVFKQTYRPLELIVVDDGSTDTTAAQARLRFREGPKDVGASLVKIEKNTGAANALFVGFSRAIGGFVSWLSADDAFIDANKTNAQVKAMEKKGADWSYFKQFYSGSDFATARLVRPGALPWRSLFGHLFERNPSFRVLGLLYQNPINGSSTMIRKSCVARFGQFDPTLKNVDPDGDLWMRYSVLGAKVVAVDGSPLFYRIHPQQTSQKQTIMFRGMELTRLRMLTALSNLGALQKMISDHSNLLMFTLARKHLAEKAPFTTMFLCDQILKPDAKSNVALKSVARLARNRARESGASQALDAASLLDDVAAASESRTFKDFLERSRKEPTSLLFAGRTSPSQRKVAI